MTHPKAATFRRDLLGTAVLGAAIGLPDLAAPPHAAEPGPAGAAPTPFIAWLDSIGGRYRQLVDIPDPNEGYGLMWSWVFLDTAPAAFGVAPSDLGLAIVLRHKALPLALGDAIWRKFQLGQTFHFTDPATKSAALRNYFVNSRPGDLRLIDASLDRLIARGVKVGACNVALTALSGMIAKRMGLPPDQVRQEWIAGLVPGVQLVPSGIVAVNGAQARGCAYCYAG